MAIDQRDKLKDNPFDYQVMKNKKIRIFWENREIMILNEKDSTKLLRKIEGKAEFEVQLALAKVTGNFKHGNERS